MSDRGDPKERRRRRYNNIQQIPQTPIVMLMQWTWLIVSSTIFLVILFYLIGVANGRRLSSYSCSCTDGTSGVVNKITPYYKNIIFR
jgi:hypothetical protein